MVRSVLKCVFLRYLPHTIPGASRVNEQLFKDIPREDSVISLGGNYLDIYFDVLREDDGGMLLAADNTRFVNLAPILLFSEK